MHELVNKKNFDKFNYTEHAQPELRGEKGSFYHHFEFHVLISGDM